MNLSGLLPQFIFPPFTSELSSLFNYLNSSSLCFLEPSSENSRFLYFCVHSITSLHWPCIWIDKKQNKTKQKRKKKSLWYFAVKKVVSLLSTSPYLAKYLQKLLNYIFLSSSNMEIIKISDMIFSIYILRVFSYHMWIDHVKKTIGINYFYSNNLVKCRHGNFRNETISRIFQITV